jgi:hypothetical protein
MAGWELFNHRHLVNSPLNETGFGAGDRARILQQRMERLDRRVGDMELLVMVLLGTSSLYAVVLVASSYFSASSFARQADQTIGHIQDQIGLAMGELRDLQEETELRLRRMTAVPVTKGPMPDLQPAGWEAQVKEIAARLTAWQDRPLSEQARLELLQDENTATYLEVAAGARAASALAGLYLGFGRLYASSDAARSRFYLERALRLAAPESPQASEIQYELACHSAACRDFLSAMRELTAAFERQFKTLDERLARDIEERGKLYELASTPPFEKAVNDLLLNMSIGIG